MFVGRNAQAAVDPVQRDRARRIGVAVGETLQPLVRALGADARRHLLEEPEHRRPHRRQHGVVLVPFRLIGMLDAVPLLHRRRRHRSGFETDQRVRNLVGRCGRESGRAFCRGSAPSLRRAAVVADNDTGVRLRLREESDGGDRKDDDKKILVDTSSIILSPRLRLFQPLSHLLVVRGVARPALRRRIPSVVLDGHVDATVDEELHRLVRIRQEDQMVQDARRLVRVPIGADVCAMVDQEVRDVEVTVGLYCGCSVTGRV